MKSKFWFIGVTLFQIAFGQTINLSPLWDSTRILENPHKGWYHHYPDNGIHRYPMASDSEIDTIPGLDNLFIRLAWSWFEPAEGKYDWTWIDTIVNRWVPKGYAIGIAISAKETGIKNATPDAMPGYATPKWVYDAGAKGELQNNSYWEPDYDDPIFLAKLNAFHAALGKRYANKPWLSYVQMASYGTWGEGHNWPASLKQYPFSTLKKHIDIYLKNYPGVKICISDDAYSGGIIETERELLKKYVEEKGLFWTDHSIMVDYHAITYPQTYSIKTPVLFNDTWKSRPVQLELEHYQKIKSFGHWTVPNGLPKGQSTLRGAVNLAHATWVGYHGDAKTWFSENPDITRDLVNRIGYWFFPVSIMLPQTLVGGTSQSIQMSWKNRGVAPAYNRYCLRVKLQNQNHTFTQVLTEMNNTFWMPEETKTENYVLNLPPDIPAGRYDLSVVMAADTFPDSRKVELALNNAIQDTLGYYRLAKVEVISTNSIRNFKRIQNPQRRNQSNANYLINGRYLGHSRPAAKNIPKLRENTLIIELEESR